MNMIQEDYINLEQAKTLKELGFPQDVPTYLEEQIINRKTQLVAINRYREEDNIYVRPTLSLVQKWLMKEKNIIVVASPDFDDITKELCYVWCYDIWVNDKPLRYEYNAYDTYELALSAGIDKCIELLKSK